MFCGVDEAGRGPAIGPLVVGCVFVEDDSLLRELGVRDSKKLTPKRREEIFEVIVSECVYSIVSASAEEIDEKRKRYSLNDIEIQMFHQAVSAHPADTVYADCPDVDEVRFSRILSASLNGMNVVGKHKADDTYPVVSAASIVAKVTRDRAVEAIQKEFGTDIGSGYPSDEVTMAFIEKWIKQNGACPPHTRRSWEPVKKLLSDSRNTKITDW